MGLVGGRKESESVVDTFESRGCKPRNSDARVVMVSVYLQGKGVNNTHRGYNHNYKYHLVVILG